MANPPKREDALLDHILGYRRIIRDARQHIQLWRIAEPGMTAALDDIDTLLKATP